MSFKHSFHFFLYRLGPKISYYTDGNELGYIHDVNTCENTKGELDRAIDRIDAGVTFLDAGVTFRLVQVGAVDVRLNSSS